MKRTVTSLTLAAFFIGLCAAGTFMFGGKPAPVQAQDVAGLRQERSLIRRCTNGTINGNYAYQASGTFTQAIPQAFIPAGPFAVNGLLSFNSGSLTVKGAQSFNGTIVPLQATGTYNVNDDCTGTGTDVTGVPYSFVIADGGDEIRVMVVAPGTVITGVAKRL